MSYTIVHRTSLDVSGDRAMGLKAVPFSQGIFKTTGTSAELVSPLLQSPAPFDRLVGSWNVSLPSSGTLILQAKIFPAASGKAAWSPWFELGRQNGGRFFSPGRQENAYGFVATDTLTLKKPAAAFRYRIILRQPASSSAILRLVAMSVSNGKIRPERPPIPGPWVREIRVAQRSQMTVQSKYRRDICSPTSLAMAISHWGQTLPTTKVAEDVQDQTSEIYGDWTFNTAFAGSRGLVSYFSYLDSLRALEREIAAGRPVVASVSFGPGELSGAPIKKTKGHLMLVVGFTRTGDVIVLDPAAPSAKTARRIYRREQFREVWLVHKRGAAYLIGPLRGRVMMVGVTDADLMAKPSNLSVPGRHDPNLLSQVLYGEPVLVRAAHGDWARVEVEDQPHFSKNRWGGYPGWIQAKALACAPPLPVNRVVKAKAVRAVSGGKTILFSLGTRLDAVGAAAGKTVVRLIDSRTAVVPSSALETLSPAKNALKRRRILDSAGLFLGLRYVWGGRSGVQARPSWGVDCSGLASLAYRAAGLLIPRDAADQKRRARPITAREMKPGDLIFLSAADGSPRITHVMIYAGQDAFIESRHRLGAHRGNFLARFGVPLADLKSGHTVLDRAFSPPRRRRIYFGSCL
ncbi:MAG TPA: C39 family peptidase [Elusimicrobiota bacterium]|nr:C39 family peptidase [Elusimicrobiota bacterium]